MSKSAFTRFVEKRWYQKSPGVLSLLAPLEWLFVFLAHLRRNRQLKVAYTPATPLIIVGNLSVGGTGKTPLLISLVKVLQNEGYTPAVISRGYGSRAEHAENPVLVTEGKTPADVGDEPIEIFQATGVFMLVGKNRLASVKKIEQEHKCDVILADDGLQNYLLGRHIEIIVVDGSRMWGNGHCLPVGPLREPPVRANGSPFVVVTQPLAEVPLPKPYFRATTAITGVVNIVTGEQKPPEYLSALAPLVAVAGIGNPNKFFSSLASIGLSFKEAVFPDHHVYHEGDFVHWSDSTIVMTAKDAVKCRQLAKPNFWVLQIESRPEAELITKFIAQLKNIHVKYVK